MAFMSNGQFPIDFTAFVTNFVGIYILFFENVIWLWCLDGFRFSWIRIWKPVGGFLSGQAFQGFQLKAVSLASNIATSRSWCQNIDDGLREVCLIPINTSQKFSQGHRFSSTTKSRNRVENLDQSVRACFPFNWFWRIFEEKLPPKLGQIGAREISQSCDKSQIKLCPQLEAILV